MSRIERIEVTLHRLPLDPPYHAAWDRQPRRAFPVAVYRVFDSDGRQGVAAGDAMRGLVDYLHLFVGEDPCDLVRHGAVLANIDFFDGRPWPLELALWDLVGHIRDEPAWRMAGGRTQRIRAYASSGSHWSLAEVDDRVGHLLDRGFTALKLRMGRPRLDDDLAVFGRVRDVAGDRLELFVDCNQGWRMPWDTHPAWDVDHAASVAAELEGLDVSWMEEPLDRDDLDGHVELRQRTSIRIAGGEMTRHRPTLDALLDRGCLDVFQPDAAVTAGFGWLVDFATRVAAAGHVFTPHTWGSGAVLMANAHLAAGAVAAPVLEFPEDPPGWTLDRRDFVLQEPIDIDAAGDIVLDDAPGFGLRLDEERLAATRADVATYT